jgi:hypothetical protein
MVLDIIQIPNGFNTHGVMQYTTGFTTANTTGSIATKTKIVETLHQPGNPSNLSRRDRVLRDANARNIAALAAAPLK